MADRNQYPMMPQNFNPSLLQQHQLQQAQQQAGLNNNNLGGIPNADSARMWQAMQKAQDTYRAQNGTGMTETQVNQQMASLLQSQNLARMQAQHMGQQSQQQQQQQQQQFGLAAAQIAAGQQPQQHANFHDQQQGQAQMPAQFGGMNPGASQNFGNNQNRAAMMQAFNQSQVSRQLELMGMAQNQQHQSPQAAPANFAGRMAQQGGMGQAGQPQGSPMFSAGQLQAEGSRASPPHPAQLPNQPGAQGLPAGRRPMNFGELRDRAMQIQAYITQQENLAMSLNTQRQGMDPNLFMSKMQTLAGEVRNKKELLSKLTAAMSAAGAQAQQQQHQGPNPGMGSSPAPQHQQLGPSGQAQPAWMAQHGTAQAQGLQMARAALPSRGPSQPQNMQTSPQTHSASLMQQNGMGVPQRPGSTMAPGQLPNQAAQFMQQQQQAQQEQQLRLQQQQAAMQQQAQQQNGMPNQSLPPPLDKAKFEESYAAYRNNRPVNINEQMMQIDGRPIDLHALHFHVLTEGGGNKVTSLDAWSMIGARIGFQAFPATDSKPAMAGPGVGDRLRHIYAEYLQQFETIYVRSVLQKKGMFPPNGNVPGNLGQMNNGGPAANAAQMNAMMMYAHVPAADLHARGVHENVIRFVETHRAQLQRSVKQQMSFRGVVQNAGAASGEQGLGVNGQFSQPQAGPGPSMAQSQARGPQQGLSPAGMSLAPHNGHPPNMNGGMAQQGRPTRPSPEQSHQASNFVAHVKTEFLKNNLPNMTQHIVPDQEKVEYNRVLEQAFHASQEMDPKLPMFFYVLKEGDLIKKLVAIILTTREQRSLISNGTQKYILSLITLRNIIQQLAKCNAQFAAAVQGFTSQPQASAAPASPNPGPNGAPPRPPVIPQQPQYQAQQHPSPHRQPTPQSTQLTPSLAAQSIAGNRPVTLNQPPPAKRKPQPQHQPNASTPSAPTPPASTPAAATPSAATPAAAAAAASPKTPKSPKVKAGVKPKPAPPPPKPRKNSKAVLPIPEAAPPSAPSPSSSLKRPREDEEVNAGTSVVSSAPSPKKAKTEWEAPPSEEVIKKEQQIENIKTDEDANAFLQQMTELLQMAAGNEGEEMSNISETLDMILKGCGQDTSDLGASGSGIAPNMSASDTTTTNADEFQDYFDFTGCAPDEDSSKPATPELVSSSSTNPSPESASDPADAATAAGDNRLANLKVEHSYENDSLRLGAWKEIDGGESAYYHSDRWNWEAPMQVLDQPWAFAS
ncbi:hypothetical protein FIBSPDRAFT_928183 [Athelia psychrophila]|uniref:ARID domain-containing protein n=1 Tax=Athelia psychrophila TaxID=1759441 RepID=A0A166QN01_9AGAM|nr:hypothetical protein FIBSPDRAFT_928183 [Fibularhizoctonia sp. CBS 109695]